MNKFLSMLARSWPIKEQIEYFDIPRRARAVETAVAVKLAKKFKILSAVFFALSICLALVLFSNALSSIAVAKNEVDAVAVFLLPVCLIALAALFCGCANHLEANEIAQKIKIEKNAIAHQDNEDVFDIAELEIEQPQPAKKTWLFFLTFSYFVGVAITSLKPGRFQLLAIAVQIFLGFVAFILLRKEHKNHEA